MKFDEALTPRERNLWQRLIDEVRFWLAKHGLRQLKPEEISEVLREALARTVHGNPEGRGRTEGLQEAGAFSAKEGRPFSREATPQELSDFVDWVSRDPDPRGELALHRASGKEARDVLDLGGPDISGMVHVLKADDIKHAFRSHGDAAREASREPAQRALTAEDIKRIPDVLRNYDGIDVHPRENNRTSIIYEKEFPDGKIVYVERIIETSRKHEPRLVTKTAWALASSGVESTPAPVYTPGRNKDIATPPAPGKPSGPGDTNFSTRPERSPEEVRADEDTAIQALGKASPRLGFMARFFGSPEYWTFPPMRKVFQIFRNRHDRAQEILNDVMGDGALDGWKALDKEQKSLLTDIVDIADVRELKPKDVEPWMKEQGIPEPVREVWRLMRQGYDKLLTERLKPYEDMLAQGINPDVQYVDSKGDRVSMSLREAVNEMRSLEGSYAPRIRPTGDFAVLARRKGPDGEWEYSRHHTLYGGCVAQA